MESTTVSPNGAAGAAATHSLADPAAEHIARHHPGHPVRRGGSARRAAAGSADIEPEMPPAGDPFPMLPPAPDTDEPSARNRPQNHLQRKPQRRPQKRSRSRKRQSRKHRPQNRSRASPPVPRRSSRRQSPWSTSPTPLPSSAASRWRSPPPTTRTPSSTATT